jgi:putative ABC transport system permease protein
LAIVLLESCVLAVIGGALGIVGGHGVAYLGASLLAGRGGPVANLFAIGALEPVVFGGTVALGALAGLLPAALAYRTEVAENLAPLS